MGRRNEDRGTSRSQNSHSLAKRRGLTVRCVNVIDRMRRIHGIEPIIGKLQISYVCLHCLRGNALAFKSLSCL